MLKLVIIGLSFAIVSGAPLESKPLKTPIVSYKELVRPSPINPDIPMDPKPPERIILDETKLERDDELLPADEKQIQNVEQFDSIFDDKKDKSESGEKVGETQRSADFQTSHRIPNINAGESKFETSHHIPTHIEIERTNKIANAKIAQ
ncbi:hypothetical protein Bhyg_05603 [Pseudolycoriella hygida]|uniref:Uncharacterized protein n=1 Tax=Pseudolycoriella hygida TaxID=35572 RepID=A0A9Q0MZ06_9DIPT|nr:hypothetical protein Bhyg_05603 [Pseudolycoriella hygida]